MMDMEHAYARARMDEQLKVLDGLVGEGDESTPEELPGAPTGPKSKKKKKPASDEPEVSELVSVSILERIEKRQVESLKRLQSLEHAVKENTKTTKSVKDSLEALWGRVDDMAGQVNTLQSEAAALRKKNTELQDKFNNLDAYWRRWNLRVAGIPESPGEDIKKIIVDLFGQISPDIANQLALTVDIAHRAGPNRPTGQVSSSRRVIVRLLSRSHRDKIWRDARTSELLKERKIKIMEDLTQDTKDSRNQLWPQVERARREGKRAGFRGAHAYIEGRKVSAQEL